MSNNLQSQLLVNLRLTGLTEQEIAAEIGWAMQVYDMAKGVGSLGQINKIESSNHTWGCYELYNNQYYCLGWIGGPQGRLVFTFCPGDEPEDNLFTDFKFFRAPETGPRLKILKWSDDDWQSTDSLHSQPIVGLGYIYISGNRAENFDVFTVSIITGVREWIGKGFDTILQAKAAAQRWWKEQIAGLYE